MKARQILAMLMAAGLIVGTVFWVRWAQYATKMEVKVVRTPAPTVTVISLPQQVANAVSEAEALKGVTAGTKFSVEIQNLSSTHADGDITMEGRGKQHFAADLTGGKWVVTLQ